jgi:hypothetical protein
MPAASIAFEWAMSFVVGRCSCMVSSCVFMALSQPLGLPESRVAFEATRLALDSGNPNGYECQ